MAKLQDDLKSAQQTNTAKRDFLSCMSHENRTPMNAIIGMTTIAAAQIGDNARTKDCLEKISFSSKHLLSLINDILDVTTIIYPQAAARGLEFKASVHNFTGGAAGRRNAHKPDFD